MTILKSPLLQYNVKRMIALFCLCTLQSGFGFSQLKYISSEVQVSPAMIDFGSRIHSYNPKDVLKPSVGSEVSFQRNFRNMISFGVTGFFSSNALPEDFRFNELKSIDELKYAMKPYHDPYSLGIYSSKRFEVNRDYSVSFAMSLGLTANNYGKLMLPVNPDLKLGYSYVSLVPKRSFENVGYFAFPTVDFRKHFFPLYVAFRAGYIYRKTATQMLSRKLDNEKHILEESAYLNTISYSSFNGQIVLGWEF